MERSSAVPTAVAFHGATKVQWSGVSAAASAQASHSRNKAVIERRLRGSLGIGVARNEVEMGTSPASASDGSETPLDKDFPESVF